MLHVIGFRWTSRPTRGRFKQHYHAIWRWQNQVQLNFKNQEISWTIQTNKLIFNNQGTFELELCSLILISSIPNLLFLSFGLLEQLRERPQSKMNCQSVLDLLVWWLPYVHWVWLSKRESWALCFGVEWVWHFQEYFADAYCVTRFSSWHGKIWEPEHVCCLV